jgi:ketosteroid isomerase-like protein
MPISLPEESAMLHIQPSAPVCLMLQALTVVCTLVLGVGIIHGASGDEEAVRRVINRFPEAWNRHDMNAFGALFAPDADFVNVVGAYWKGREAIQLNHAFTHGVIPIDSPGVTLPRAIYGIFKTSTVHHQHIDIRFLRKDVAVAHVQSELLGDTRTKKPRHTLLVFILTQENGHWLIAVVQNTEMNRPPELNR